MRIDKINRLLQKRDSLTPEELQKLSDGIMNNKKAREMALTGALSLGKMNVANAIMEKDSVLKNKYESNITAILNEKLNIQGWERTII